MIVINPDESQGSSRLNSTDTEIQEEVGEAKRIDSSLFIQWNEIM